MRKHACSANRTLHVYGCMYWHTFFQFIYSTHNRVNIMIYIKHTPLKHLDFKRRPERRTCASSCTQCTSNAQYTCLRVSLVNGSVIVGLITFQCTCTCNFEQIKLKENVHFNINRRAASSILECIDPALCVHPLLRQSVLPTLSLTFC